MALVLKDRVLETASAPGTGTVTLLGATTGYQTFDSAIGNGNTTYYAIVDQSGSNWEVGVGTVGSGTLIRTTPITGSAATPVDFSSGTQNVFVTYPASKSVNLDANGVAVIGTAAALGGTTNPIIAATGASSNYIQQYIYNATNDISSSADYVAYPNNGADSHGWVDMGITSLSYADTTYTVTGPNESYIFGSAPSGSSTSGNLVYATDSTGTANSHQWYVGGFTQAKSAWKMQLTASNLQISVPIGFGSSPSYGTTGQVLTSQGSGSVPTWTTISAGSGTSIGLVRAIAINCILP